MKFGLPANPWFDRLAVAAMAALSCVVLAAMTLAPRHADGAVAVVYAPWTSSRAALLRAAAAGARFVRFGALPFIVVVMPDARGYAARARAGGALFTADPQAVGGCAATETP